MSDHQGRTTLRDSLIVALSAEHRRAASDVASVVLAGNVLRDVNAIEKELDRHEDAELLKEMGVLTETFGDMRKRNERREIAGLFMEFLRSVATSRSETLNRWALEATIKLAGMTPAGVNNDHIDAILKLVDDAVSRLKKANEAT